MGRIPIGRLLEGGKGGGPGLATPKSGTVRPIAQAFLAWNKARYKTGLFPFSRFILWDIFPPSVCIRTISTVQPPVLNRDGPQSCAAGTHPIPTAFSPIHSAVLLMPGRAPPFFSSHGTHAAGHPQSSAGPDGPQALASHG